MIRAFTRSQFSLLLLLTAFSPFALRADVIFDNITNNVGGLDGLDAPVLGSNAVGGVAGASAAGSFTATADYSMTSASVFVNLAAVAGDDSDFDLSLYSSSGGLPGTLIETLGTDISAPGGDTDTTVDSFSPIALTADTTYWLVLTPYDSKSDVAWLFGGSPDAPLASSNAEAETWTAHGEHSEQFEIEGTLNTPPVTTPEPSSLYLSGAALLVLLGARRARKAFNTGRP